MVLQGKSIIEDVTRVSVMLRPEHLSVWRKGERVVSNHNWNILEGKVLGQVFLGSLLRLAIAVGNTTFLVDVQNKVENRFRSGEEVEIGFPPEVVHYLYREEV
jgi:ABC-type Fe3+/spermidine/putrescine transport system ATPase subunit